VPGTFGLLFDLPKEGIYYIIKKIRNIKKMERYIVHNKYER